jgi:alpha-glucosidase
LPFKNKKIEVDKEKLDLNTLQIKGENYLIIDKDFTELHIFGA